MSAVVYTDIGDKMFEVFLFIKFSATNKKNKKETQCFLTCKKTCCMTLTSFLSKNHFPVKFLTLSLVLILILVNHRKHMRQLGRISNTNR